MPRVRRTKTPKKARRARTPKKAGRTKTPKKAGRARTPKKSNKSKKSSSSDDSGMLGYCMKCQEKKAFVTSEVVTMKNGRKAKKGKCECGVTMFRIL